MQFVNNSHFSISVSHQPRIKPHYWSNIIDMLACGTQNYDNIIYIDHAEIASDFRQRMFIAC